MAAAHASAAVAVPSESFHAAAPDVGCLRVRVAAAIGRRRLLLVVDGLDGLSEQGAFMKWPPAPADVADEHEPITTEWMNADLLAGLLGDSHGLRILVTRRESLGGAFNVPVPCLDQFSPRRIIMPQLTHAEAVLLVKQRQVRVRDGEKAGKCNACQVATSLRRVRLWRPRATKASKQSSWRTLTRCCPGGSLKLCMQPALLLPGTPCRKPSPPVVALSKYV